MKRYELRLSSPKQASKLFELIHEIIWTKDHKKEHDIGYSQTGKRIKVFIR